MKIELRYFASLREAVGMAGESLVVPAEIVNLGQLRHFLQARGGVWQQALSDQRALRMALNHVVCDRDGLLIDGAEVAFFPPVTGG